MLASTDWELHFSRTTSVNSRNLGQYSTVLNTGDTSTFTTPQFKFELGWLLQDGFLYG
jgi:outer membrane translocation and assembly module TamA